MGTAHQFWGEGVLVVLERKEWYWVGSDTSWLTLKLYWMRSGWYSEASMVVVRHNDVKSDQNRIIVKES